MAGRRHGDVPRGRSGSPHAKHWKSQFGERLRALRLDRGISQEKLGELAGVHRTYVGALERGEQNVSLTNLHELALALGVDVVDFFLE
jgi:transcriptional regulator with XRE-family HTH domain